MQFYLSLAKAKSSLLAIRSPKLADLPPALFVESSSRDVRPSEADDSIALALFTMVSCRKPRGIITLHFGIDIFIERKKLNTGNSSSRGEREEKTMQYKIDRSEDV